MLVITHYQRLLELHRARQVHVMVDGRIEQVGRRRSWRTSSRSRATPSTRRRRREHGARIANRRGDCRQLAGSGAAGSGATLRARDGAGEARDERSGVEDEGGAGADRGFAAVAAELPGGAAGAQACATDAIGRFGALGLPHRRIEAWKYTDLRNLMKEALPLAACPLRVSRKAELKLRWVRSPSSTRTASCSSTGSYAAELSDAVAALRLAVLSLARALAEMTATRRRTCCGDQRRDDDADRWRSTPLTSPTARSSPSPTRPSSKSRC